MADIDFPTKLPIPLQSGYSLQTVSPLQRTDLDSGRARQRRRFTSVPTMVSVLWRMKDGEAQVFEGFFRWTIKDGSKWFNCPLRTPVGYKLYECRFTDIYEGPTLENYFYWNYTAELEIRHRQTIDSEWNNFPEFIIGSSIIDQAVNREWPEYPEEF